MHKFFQSDCHLVIFQVDVLWCTENMLILGTGWQQLCKQLSGHCWIGYLKLGLSQALYLFLAFDVIYYAVYYLQYMLFSNSNRYCHFEKVPWHIVVYSNLWGALTLFGSEWSFWGWKRGQCNKVESLAPSKFVFCSLFSQIKVSRWENIVSSVKPTPCSSPTGIIKIHGFKDVAYGSLS